MSSYVNRHLTCMCCGKPFEARLLKGFLSTEMGLDTCPHEPAAYDKIVMCPHCGYATSEPYTKADPAAAAIIESNVYKAIMENTAYDETVTKLLLAAHIDEKTGKLRKATDDYAYAFWSLREQDAPQTAWAGGKLVTALEKYLNENQDVERAMMLVDIQRQLGRFDDARETLGFLEGFIQDNELLLKVAELERKLIGYGDSTPHMMSEVKA